MLRAAGFPGRGSMQRPLALFVGQDGPRRNRGFIKASQSVVSDAGVWESGGPRAVASGRPLTLHAPCCSLNMVSQKSKSRGRGGKRAGAGRPPMDDADRLDQLVQFRVTSAERELLSAAAKAAELSLSQWLRGVAVRAARRSQKHAER